MRIKTALFSAAAFGIGYPSAHASLLVYEGFAGADYVVNEPNYGNVNPTNGRTWTSGVSSSAQDPLNDMPVVAGNLSYAGLPASTGNQLSVDYVSGTPNSNGKIARLTVDGDLSTSTADVVNSGTLYYSFLLQVSNISSLTAFGGNSGNGAFIAGFNNSPGNAGTQANFAGSRLILQRSQADANRYNVGIRNDVNGASVSNSNFVTASSFGTTDTVLVVGAYQFVDAGATNDVAKLWINPDAATFGASEGDAPAPIVTSTGQDISGSQIASFFFRLNSIAPQTYQVDELRIGTTWADVTPVPEPGSVGLVFGAMVGIAVRRRRACR